MVRRARFSCASRTRENVHPPTRVWTRNEHRHFSRSALKTRFARVTSSGLPFPPIPPVPSLTDRDPLPPPIGTSQARQIGAPRGRAGTPRRTPRRTRARVPNFAERRFRKANARHFSVTRFRRHSRRRRRRASPPVADARSHSQTRRGRSRASPNLNAPDPPNPSLARVRLPREASRARADARDDALVSESTRRENDFWRRDETTTTTTTAPPRSNSPISRVCVRLSLRSSQAITKRAPRSARFAS